MQNRIWLEMSGVKGVLDFNAILRTPRDVYARFVTSSDQVLPRARRGRNTPALVFGLDASSDPEAATSTSQHGTMQPFAAGYLHARSTYAGRVDFDMSSNYFQ